VKEDNAEISIMERQIAEANDKVSKVQAKILSLGLFSSFFKMKNSMVLLTEIDQLFSPQA
jgi:hypothetical protein